MPSQFEPPVNPFSAPDEIRRWIERLRGLRADHAADAAALSIIKERIADAESWLDFRGYKSDRR